MQSKGIIKWLAALLGLASIFQLSFTFVTRNIEAEAEVRRHRRMLSECIEPVLKTMQTQFVIMGQGEKWANEYFATLPHKYPGQIAVDIGFNPEKACECSELREQLSNAMGALSEKQRIIITLREVDGLSYEEIASVLDIQIGTVMSRLHYARLNLQSALRTYIDCKDVDKKS